MVFGGRVSWVCLGWSADFDSKGCMVGGMPARLLAPTPGVVFCQL